MKLKSWMEAHIVRARRKKKEPKKEKEKKGKHEAVPENIGTPVRIQPTPTKSTSTKPEVVLLPAQDAIVNKSIKKFVNPSTTFLRCGDSVSAEASLSQLPQTPPYLSINCASGTNTNNGGYVAIHTPYVQHHDSQRYLGSNGSPVLYSHGPQPQQKGLCQCFGSLGLNDNYKESFTAAGVALNVTPVHQGSPRPGAPVHYLSQYHLEEGGGSCNSTVNLNSPRQRSKIRTNPWLLTPKISRDASNYGGRPLLASISTSSESCTESHRDSFVSSTEGGDLSPIDRIFPPNPFTPRSRRSAAAASVTDEDGHVVVRGKPLSELVAVVKKPSVRQCLFPGPPTSTPVKGSGNSATIGGGGRNFLLRPEPPLRKRSLRSSRKKKADQRLHSVCTEDDDDDSDECDTLNEMGNFSEHYNAYFDRETDILDDDDDVLVVGGKLMGSGGGGGSSRASTAGGRLTLISNNTVRGSCYYRPPSYALAEQSQHHRPPRDLLRGNDEDYSEKLEFADMDEAYSEMSGSLEEEEEEGELEDVVVGGSCETKPIRIRIDTGVGGGNGEKRLYDDDAQTPDSAFPSSESELSSLMAAGSCCSAGSTPLAETASSSGASDSGRSTIHDSYRQEEQDRLMADVITPDGTYDAHRPRGRAVVTYQQHHTSRHRSGHLLAADTVRESLEDKVRWLQLERLVVQEKIREAQEEQLARHLDREKFRRELVLHRRQVLLRTLHELRLKMDQQSLRLQEAYQVTMHTQLLARKRQQQLREPPSPEAKESAAQKRRSWEIVGRLM